MPRYLITPDTYRQQCEVDAGLREATGPRQPTESVCLAVFQTSAEATLLIQRALDHYSLPEFVLYYKHCGTAAAVYLDGEYLSWERRLRDFVSGWFNAPRGPELAALALCEAAGLPVRPA